MINTSRTPVGFYVDLVFALYSAAGRSDDLDNDYRSKAAVLSLVALAHIANIAFALVILRPDLFSEIVARRNVVMILVGLSAVPWGLWLDDMIDRRKEVNPKNEETDNAALRSKWRNGYFSLAVLYVVSSYISVGVLYLAP